MKGALLLYLCILLVFPELMAQYQIKGKITDSVDAKPVPGAIARLLTSDSLTVARAVCDDKGMYEMNITTAGQYYLYVTALNYQPAKVNVLIAPGQTGIQYHVALRSNAGDLGNVTVSSMRRTIEQTDDKIVYNLENDPTAKSENVLDLLRKTPMVAVDGNGAIQLNGQTNFKVLLNGRETAMFANNISEVLRGFPGATVSKIEVITNPSAKYDAEGVGGIINIITKKRVSGYTGSISAKLSTNHSGNLNANFSLKSNKIGFTFGYGNFVTFNQPLNFFSSSVSLVPSSFISRENNGYGRSRNLFNFGNSEIAFEADSLTTLVVYGNTSGGTVKNYRRHDVSTVFSNGIVETGTLFSDTKFVFPNYNVGVDFIRRGLKNRDNELSIRLFGDFNTNNSFTLSDQRYAGYTRDFYSVSDAYSKQYTVQADYVKAIAPNQKVEIGIKKIIRYAQSNFSVRVKYVASADYKVDPGSADIFKYDQDVDGFYASYQFQIKPFQVRAGARAEHTRINGTFDISSTTIKQRYTSFIPNIQVTVKPSVKWTIVGNYNKRLERPFIQSLNPFVNQTDSLNLSFGNPELAPQNLHIFSVQNRIMIGSSFANIALFYQLSNDKITSYSTFDAATGITKQTSANVGREEQISLSINHSAKLNAKLSLVTSVSPRFVFIKNKLNSRERNQGFTGNGNLNLTYTPSNLVILNMTVGGGMPPPQIQTSFILGYFYRMGATFKLFKEKVFLSLEAQNLHRSNFHYIAYLRTPSIETTNTIEQLYRSFALGVTYNFGKLAESVSKKRGVANDDQMSN